MPKLLFVVARPDAQQVSVEKMQAWALEAIANGEIKGPADLPVEELAQQLHDAGLLHWFGEIKIGL